MRIPKTHDFTPYKKKPRITKGEKAREKKRLAEEKKKQTTKRKSRSKSKKVARRIWRKLI